MLFALSTTHEIELATMGGLFIAFALLSSFFFPRFSPDFPGRKGLKWYLPLAFCFFVAMLSAVVLFGKEKKEAQAVMSTHGGASPYIGGDPQAGKLVFMSAGCSACHTFKPANSSSTIGPDLDDIASYAAKAGLDLTEFTGEAIETPPAKYVPAGFSDSMPKNFGTTLNPQQIVDLVAFVDSAAS